MRVLDFANEIRDMHRELEYLRAENDELREYKRKYHELLDESVKHGEQMMVGWMALLTSDNVLITKPNEQESKS